MVEGSIQVWHKELETWLKKFIISYDEAEYLGEKAGKYIVYENWLDMDEGQDITDEVTIFVYEE